MRGWVLAYLLMAGCAEGFWTGGRNAPPGDSDDAVEATADTSVPTPTPAQTPPLVVLDTGWPGWAIPTADTQDTDLPTADTSVAPPQGDVDSMAGAGDTTSDDTRAVGDTGTPGGSGGDSEGVDTMISGETFDTDVVDASRDTMVLGETFDTDGADSSWDTVLDETVDTDGVGDTVFGDTVDTDVVGDTSPTDSMMSGETMDTDVTDDTGWADSMVSGETMDTDVTDDTWWSETYAGDTSGGGDTDVVDDSGWSETYAGDTSGGDTDDVPGDTDVTDDTGWTETYAGDTAGGGDTDVVDDSGWTETYAGDTSGGGDTFGGGDTDIIDDTGRTDTYPGDTSNPPSEDTGVMDTVLPVDTDVDSDTDILCDDHLAWWPGADVDGDGVQELPYRVLMDVIGGDEPFPRAPVTMDVNFRQVLDDLGVTDSVDLSTIRVVLQRCDAGWPSMPSQFADRLIALDQKRDHVSPAGDEEGTVAFLYDDDGQWGTVESLPARENRTVGIYFATQPVVGLEPPVSTALSLTNSGSTWRMETGKSVALFDADQGGLMSSISRGASGFLTSQTASCCGNGMHFWDDSTYAGPPWGWVTPQSDAGLVEVLADGPILAALRATGVREGIVPGTTTDYGTVGYGTLYWGWAGRPELWYVTTQLALTDATTEHEIDASFAFRPFQSYHDPNLSMHARFVNEHAERRGAVIGATHGVAIGVAHPSTYHARIANPVGSLVGGPINERYFAVHGNDAVPLGTPTPATVPAGTRFFDNIGVVILPFAGTYSAARPVLRSVMEGVDVLPSLTEQAP